MKRIAPMTFYVLIKTEDTIDYYNKTQYREKIETVHGIYPCFLEAKQQVMRSLMKDTKNSFQLSKYINFIE